VWHSDPFLTGSDRIQFRYQVDRRHIVERWYTLSGHLAQRVMDLRKSSEQPVVGLELWEGPFDDLRERRERCQAIFLPNGFPTRVDEPDAVFGMIRKHGFSLIQAVLGSVWLAPDPVA
jgi:hypothetical protein